MFGDDAAQVAVRSHIKGRIAGVEVGRRDRVPVGRQDFRFIALFNRDLIAVLYRQINGGSGRDGVERDAVLLR